MRPDSRLLTSDDIREIVSPFLIAHVISGVRKNERLCIAIMFDREEEDPELSKGTGKLYVEDSDARQSYCGLISLWLDEAVAERCLECKLTYFDRAKRNSASNPDWKGEIHACSVGGLLSTIVPMVERKTNTFLGVILGGPKRPKESYSQAWTRLRNLVSREDNISLKSIPFWKLYWNYVKVPPVTEGELQEAKSRCESIAEELVRPFELLMQIKKAESDRKIEQQAINTIDETLINARNLQTLYGSMDAIIARLQEWLCFDWGMFLSGESSRDSEELFEVQGFAGRGLRSRAKLRGKGYAFPSDWVNEANEPRHNPEFLRQDVDSLVSGEPDYWWIPLVMSDGSISGAILFGSAPEHPRTEYDGERIEERIQRLNEIAGKMASKYSELNAMAREERKSMELRQSQTQLKETIDKLEHTILGLTHQVRRPLDMIEGVLSNARDLHGRELREEINKEIALGLLVAKDAELLTRGITKIFAAELGGKFQYKPVSIDVKAELEKLSGAMHLLSGRKDISFKFFEQSPTIMMDLDSFLYVFYVLIDNALKYSYEGCTIELVCDQEGGRYAFKVKSFGLPIEDPGRVFAKLWRGENAWRYNDTGVGLGCWSASQHMARQHGELRVEVAGNLSVFIVVPPARGI